MVRRKKEDKEIREEEEETREKRGGKENRCGERRERDVGFVTAEALDIFCQGEDLESFGFSWEDLLEKPDELSECEPGTRTDVSAVLVVTDVLVSPSSVVTDCWDGVSLDSDWEFVEPQSFSFSNKRSVVLEENREEMSYEGTPVKAPPNTRRRMVPPTPQQSSHSSTEERQWQAEMAYRKVLGVLGKGR